MSYHQHLHYQYMHLFLNDAHNIISSPMQWTLLHLILGKLMGGRMYFQWVTSTTSHRFFVQWDHTTPYQMVKSVPLSIKPMQTRECSHHCNAAESTLCQLHRKPSLTCWFPVPPSWKLATLKKYSYAETTMLRKLMERPCRIWTEKDQEELLAPDMWWYRPY